MLCYRDRTFCNDVTCKKFNTCKTALTTEISNGAIRIGLPIAQYTDRLECYKEVQNESL